jgi:hypothetical protein
VADAQKVNDPASTLRRGTPARSGAPSTGPPVSAAGSFSPERGALVQDLERFPGELADPYDQSRGEPPGAFSDAHDLDG